MRTFNILLSIAFISASIQLSINAEELKGNKTNLHVSQYGEKINKKNLKVGVKAPNFSAIDSNGNKVSLSDFKNKNSVLLVFYPGDSTPTCTKQLCAIRDDYKDLEKIGIKVFGINQADSQSHNKFINENKLQFPLIIDKNSEISKAYDCMGFLGFINRTVVLINKKGDIVFFERGVPDLSPNKLSKLI
ncbi:MAG: peroxiredoxin [Candidatus Sericytochromatia bacterium]